MVPSTTLSPIWGICTSTAIGSIRYEVADRVDDLVGVRENRLLQRRRKRRMRIHRGDATNRRVEVFEGMFPDNRRNLAADSASQAILMNDQHLAGFFRGLEDRLAIERKQRAQVEDLNRDTIFLFDDARGVNRLPERATISNDRKIGALLANLRDAERNRELAFRNILLEAAIEALMFEVHHRIAVANG